MEAMTSTADTILLTGGTGTTGRRIADRLRGHRVRIASRSGEPRFDWHDRATWPAVLDGVTAAYLAYAPDLTLPGAAETVGEFARAAVDHGVSRLVLLSGRGEQRAQLAEQLVQQAGADWTIVRCAMFAQNFSEGAFAGQILDGAVALHVDDVPEPFLDVEDIADVAAAALTDPRHRNQVYELTGPRLLTFAEALATIGGAIDRRVVYAKVSAADLAAGLEAEGVPPTDAAALVELFGEIFDGRNSHLNDGVQRALGRPPRDFGEFVAAAADAGAWTEAA
jgi:uncharacterized protein YbjT (DUF2867 family)